MLLNSSETIQSTHAGVNRANYHASKQLVHFLCILRELQFLHFDFRLAPKLGLILFEPLIVFFRNLFKIALIGGAVAFRDGDLLLPESVDEL